MDKIDWESIAYNESIDIEFIEKYINKIDLECLTYNKNISLEFFEKHFRLLPHEQKYDFDIYKIYQNESIFKQLNNRKLMKMLNIA